MAISVVAVQHLLSAAILGGLGFAALRLNNKTALFTAVIVLTIGLLSLRSFRKIATVSVLLAMAIFFTYGTLSDMVERQFIIPSKSSGVDRDLTPFGYMVNPEAIRETYRAADPYSFFFGAQLLDTGSLEVRQVVLSSFASSELRAVALPIFFGFGWVLIVVVALATILLYSARLIKNERFRFFGLATLGLVIVYAADLHYPSSISHGPIEMLAVMAGVLSSLYETSRRSSEAAVAGTTTRPSPGRREHPIAGPAEPGRLRTRPTETI